MKELELQGIRELTVFETKKVKGGLLPVLAVLGAITTAVSVGKILDKAGEWALEGWNNPR